MVVLVLLCYLLIMQWVSIQLINARNTCPDPCICDVWAGLRRVRCVSRHLTTIETNVPFRAEVLDLSDNIISSVPDNGFMDQKLYSLQMLNLSTNHIGFISLKGFAGLRNLQILDLSKNILQTVIPSLFEDNKNLTELYLNGNKFVTTEPTPFLVSASLLKLDLAECLLSHLYFETFTEMKSLISVDLSNNLLIEIKKEVIETLPGLKSLNLLGNPVLCGTFTTQSFMAFCTKKTVALQSPCIVEKSQKIVVAPDIDILNKNEVLGTTELHPYIPWIPKDDDTANNKDRIIESSTENDVCRSIVPLAIAFSVGLLTGAINVCLGALLITCVKTKSRKHNKPDIPLLEDQMDFSLSTPIVNRRYTTRTT